MKKILLSLFCLFCFSSCLAIGMVDIDTNIPQDEYIEKQMLNVVPLLEEAKLTNNPKLYYEASVKAYNIKKTGNPKSIKATNDMLSALAIEYALQYYSLTKDKKYLNKAYKWSKIAIKDKTQQIYSIQAAILLAGAKLNLKNIKKAYILYREVDLQGAFNYEEQYKSTYNATAQVLAQRTAKRKNAWRRVLYAGALGLQSYGYTSQQYYNNRLQTHCYTIGNNVYCDSY